MPYNMPAHLGWPDKTCAHLVESSIIIIVSLIIIIIIIMPGEKNFKVERHEQGQKHNVIIIN